MKNGFFAMVSRMKYINRWALMRNEHSENLCEHSFEVASIAHALAIIGNRRFGKNLNGERAAFLGLYHDTPETLTGDMPTPVKYYSDDMREAFKEVEDKAGRHLLSMLPDDMAKYYESAFFKAEEDEYLWKIVKAADKISALIKCIEEKNAGNNEFGKALDGTRESLDKMAMPEVDAFIEEFLPSFYLSLDEQNEG